MSTLCKILFFFLLVSRGLFEIGFPKKFAMIFHLGSLLLLGILAFGHLPKTIGKEEKAKWVFAMSFVFVIFVSGLITLFNHDRGFWIAYNLFNCIVIAFGLLTIKKFSDEELFPHISLLLMFLGWFLFVGALIEHFQLYKFPGHSYLLLGPVRPASTTGSFLHYPILMPFIGFALLNLQKHRLSAFLFLASPFLAFSRSGIFIVLAAVLIYPFLQRSKKGIFAIVILFCLTLSTLVASSFFPENSYVGKVYTRVLQSTGSNAAGNQGRIAKWKTIVDEWLATNLLIGEDTGHYTNISHHFESKYISFNGISNSPESSVLQLLSNYGLLGLLFFYAFILQSYRFIETDHYWLKALLIGAGLQTLFYQSIEVVPFIFLFLLLPYISQSSVDKNSFTFYGEA